MEFLVTLHICNAKGCKNYNQLVPFLVDPQVDTRDRCICPKCGSITTKVLDEEKVKERIRHIRYKPKKAAMREEIKRDSWIVFKTISDRYQWTFPDGLYKHKQVKAVEKCLEMGCTIQDFEGCYAMILSWGWQNIDFQTLEKFMNKYLNGKSKETLHVKYNDKNFMR